MAVVSSRGEARSVRAFQALLAAYPSAFRDEYGRELALVFVDRYRAASGTWARARLWLEAVAGILVEAPKEHGRLMRHDLRDAWRILRSHAMVTTTIVITLGLGIGANTAVFSLLNAVVLRTPLPVRDADQLFTVNGGRFVSSGPEAARLSGPMFDRLRRAAPEGVGVAAMSRGVARVYTRADGERETTPASLQLVSAEFFPVLGVTPMLGRPLEEADGVAAGAPVAVISYGYWQRRFGGSADAIGRRLVVNGNAFTVVGVGPPDFVGVWLELPVDLWAPLGMQSPLRYSQSFSADGAELGRPWLPQPRIWWLHAVARVPADRVATVVGRFNAALSDQGPEGQGVVLEPFARGFSRFRQQFSTPLVALLVMAALVLLVACANVANVQLARSVGRRREMAVRMAIGAGRGRLLHQLLIESALLVAMAGAVAVLVASWAGDVLVRVATATSDGLPPFAAPLDWRVLAFAAGVALATVTLVGVGPAWRATQLDVVGALKAGARTSLGGAVRSARVLVVLQVALSLVLVTATGLFVRSFQRLLDVDLGVARERLLSVGIDPALSGTPVEELPELYRRVLDSVHGVAGVSSASLAMCGLQASCATENGFSVDGYQPRPDESVAFNVNAVTPGYFSTVGMSLIAGRDLTAHDLANTPQVAVVNKTLATTYFGHWQQALGRRFGLTTRDIEIVGVVEDARSLNRIKEPPRPGVFVPMAQRGAIPRGLEVRTSVDPASAGTAVRRAIAVAAPDLPVESIVTMEARVQRGFSQERLVVVLTSAFGALALGLAGLGLFGVMSYAVARRTPEFGLRMALGASQSQVLRSVVGDALWLVACGVALGLPAVWFGGQLTSTLVYGVSPHDSVTLAGAVVVLAGVGTACSLVPARRAARVEPVVALNQD